MRVLLSVAIICISTVAWASNSALVDSIGMRQIDGRQFIVHKIEPKETWFTLYRKYRTSVSEIQAANPEMRTLLIGRTVLIPLSGHYYSPIRANTNKPANFPVIQRTPAKKTVEYPVPAQAAKYHIVQPGETMYRLSKMYGVSIQDIQRWNNIADYTISVGSSIVVSQGSRITNEAPVVTYAPSGVPGAVTSSKAVGGSQEMANNRAIEVALKYVQRKAAMRSDTEANPLDRMEKLAKSTIVNPNAVPLFTPPPQPVETRPATAEGTGKNVPGATPIKTGSVAPRSNVSFVGRPSVRPAPTVSYVGKPATTPTTTQGGDQIVPTISAGVGLSNTPSKPTNSPATNRPATNYSNPSNGRTTGSATFVGNDYAIIVDPFTGQKKLVPVPKEYRKSDPAADASEQGVKMPGATKTPAFVAPPVAPPPRVITTTVDKRKVGISVTQTNELPVSQRKDSDAIVIMAPSQMAKAAEQTQGTPSQGKPAVKEQIEKGLVGWINDETLNPNKYFALHRTAPIGTIVKITNSGNGQSVYVKVVGTLPETAENKELVIKISKSASKKLVVPDPRFQGELSYGIPQQ